MTLKYRLLQKRLITFIVNLFFALIIFILCLCTEITEASTSSESSYKSENEKEIKAVEIISVSGCERNLKSSKSRETYNCFAHNYSEGSITLTIRGRGFPKDNLLKVQLEEHSILPLSNNENRIILNCSNLQFSTIFPNQILSCKLPNPKFVLKQKSEWLERLENYPIWMDLKILKIIKKNESNNSTDEKFFTMGILSRAVQLDLSKASEIYKTDINNNIVENFNDPLELFFSNTNNYYDWISFGIGGMKNQLQELYRRVFLTRIPSLRNIIGSFHLPQVRGVILHGPPGNGKTLIARAIAKLFKENSKVTIVNAADILSKYVGDSEKNLRHLFEGRDDNSQFENYDDDEEVNNDNEEIDLDLQTLHIIIIDEIEALFRRRVESSDESAAKAVYDGLTNQLLNLMDGVKKSKNFLIIGLTNQLYVIDRALLRPGRFEVLIEIPFPDFDGRFEMFFIHTSKLREKDCLSSDVNISELAMQTVGFSGADIAGTVRGAITYALMRYRNLIDEISLENKDEINLNSNILLKSFNVSNNDFILSIQDILESKSQISPGKILENSNKNNIIKSLFDYDGFISKSINSVNHILKSIQNSYVEHAAVIIIYGPPGTGKTVISQKLAKLWPFSVTTLLAKNEKYSNSNKNNLEEILTTLNNAVNSKENSSIIIENIENFLRDGWSTAGANIKSAIHEFKISYYPSSLNYINKKIGKRLLILTTSDKEILNDLKNYIEYDLQLTINPIQRKGLLSLLQYYSILPLSSTISNDVVRAYPSILSYRQFLRITDLALWKAHDLHLSSTDIINNKHNDLNLYSKLNEIFIKRGLEENNIENEISLNTKELQKEFGAAVRDVVSGMGLTDAFEDLFTVDDTIEGDEVYW